jgi:hypothetical protein
MIRVAHSSRPHPREAVEEIAAHLGGVHPELLLCFASPRYEAHELLRHLNHRFPDAAIVGGSTAGELVSGHSLKGSVVAMAIEGDVVEKVVGTVVEDLGPGMDLDAACRSLERHMGCPLDALDPDRHVGLVIADGLSGAEERLIEGLAERTDLAFVGGSAGDDLRFDKTRVFWGAKVWEHAAVLAVLKVPRGFEIVKTQSFQETGKYLVATEVDVAERMVLAFDGHPAAGAYAEAIGAFPGAIAEKFMSHPLARIVGGEPFVRSPKKIEGASMLFFCGVKKGERLAVMEATDILSETRRALGKNLEGGGEAVGIVDFQGVLRAMELESRGRSREYAEIFQGVPMAGFCTYGEAWTTLVNQTSTLLVFK